jgi:hypothetical protein
MKKKMSILLKFKVIRLVVTFEMVTVLFTFWLNTYWVYAQPLTNTQQDQQQPMTAASPPPSSPRLHAVKITSPTRGQEVPSGNNSNLTISGISIANATTSHCQVSVIVNDVWPYQPAIGTGPGGASDYSKWNFTLSPQYTTIKEGPNNKITAKYTCSDNPRIISYYSVNVTGVPATAAAAASASSVPQQ